MNTEDIYNVKCKNVYLFYTFPLLSKTNNSMPNFFPHILFRVPPNRNTSLFYLTMAIVRESHLP